jgi:hypothetical protein
MYGDFPAKNTVCTPYIRINIYGSGPPYTFLLTLVQELVDLEGGQASTEGSTLPAVREW